MIYHYCFANDFTWPFSSACDKQIILSWMVYNEHVLIFHGCTVNQEACYGKLLSWSLDSVVHIMTLCLAFDVLYRILNFDMYHRYVPSRMDDMYQSKRISMLDPVSRSSNMRFVSDNNDQNLIGRFWILIVIEMYRSVHLSIYFWRFFVDMSRHVLKIF